MDIETSALVLTVRAHGEHGAIVRFLTPAHGLVAGYVRGGKSQRLRAVLQPGNRVALALHSRVETQLAAATVELSRSRAGLLESALFITIAEWLTSMTADLLTEHAAHPRLHDALEGLFDAAELGVSPVEAAAAVARYELLLMSELGFALDLGSCVATGATIDLAYVSPRSAQAVSAGAGAPYADKLLPLPALLTGSGGPVTWSEVGKALHTTGFFLTRSLLTERHSRLRAARDRLVSLIARQVPA